LFLSITASAITSNVNVKQVGKVKSLLGALCVALAIALAAVLWAKSPSEFWHANITDVLLFVATVALVGATVALWRSAQRSTEITERGYVKMSHTPPGAVFDTTTVKLEAW
jgi:membrane protein YdbS with pleckstrin-like domain